MYQIATWNKHPIKVYIINKQENSSENQFEMHMFWLFHLQYEKFTSLLCSYPSTSAHSPSRSWGSNVSWDEVSYSLTITVRVRYFQPYCQSCFNFITIFQLFGTNIPFQSRKHDGRLVTNLSNVIKNSNR